MLIMLQLVCHCLISTSCLNSFFLKALILVMLLTQPSVAWLFMILISLMLKLFSFLGVSVLCNHHYFGGFIGETVGQATFGQDKVCHWIANVKYLSKIAEKQPQAAFATLVKLLQCEWQFLQHVIPSRGNYFAPLDDYKVTPSEHLLFSLPVCFGGLGVYDHNALLSLLFLPLGMLPRLSFRLFMAPSFLKLITMWRLYLCS